MLPHRHRIPAALPTLAIVAAAGTLLLSGCSGSSGPASSEAHPSINYGTQVSATPGLAGNGTGGSASAPPGAASTTGPVAPAAGPVVSIENFMFAPPSLTVPVGATVTWTNHDGEPHTVVAADGSFHSPGMDSNATFTFTFPTAGTFAYVCSIHPFMHGTVIVK